MRIKFNRNDKGELSDGDILQDKHPIKVRVTDLDISFLSLVWLVMKFMIASVVATAIIMVILIVIGTGLDLDFHSLQSIKSIQPMAP